MATFAVSILDGTTYDVTISSGVVTIVDHSNYDTSTESGHLQADFADYKKIYVTDPNGTEYVFSTLGDGDALIMAPAFETLPISTLYTAGDDGVYTMYLEAVPTWNAEANYLSTSYHHVYYNGKLYQALQASTNKNPVTETTYWEEVDAEDLPAKYRLEYKFAKTCSLIECLQRAMYLANCAIESLSCQDNLCCNTDFVNAMKLDTILQNVETLAANSDWDRVTDSINRGNQICSCLSVSSGSCNCGG